jgi:hypothetical protein
MINQVERHRTVKPDKNRISTGDGRQLNAENSSPPPAPKTPRVPIGERHGLSLTLETGLLLLCNVTNW